MFQPKITKYKIMDALTHLSQWLTLMFVQNMMGYVSFQWRFKCKRKTEKENFVIKSFCEPEMDGC